MTPLQKRFADEYLVDLNGTRAYLRATPKEVTYGTAAVEANKLLKTPKVKAYLEERMRARQERVEIKQDEVVMHLANIIRSNVTDVVNVKNGKVIIQDTGELPPEITAVIKSIKPVKGGVEVEFYDKVKALELLGKHFGMFTERVEAAVDAKVKIIDDIPKVDND